MPPIRSKRSIATKIIAARAPFGQGGIGKFLETVVEDSRAAVDLRHYFATDVKPNDVLGRAVSLDHVRRVCRLPGMRENAAHRHAIASYAFDRAVASRLGRTDTFHGFSGTSFWSFRRARDLGIEELVLESPTSHVAVVRRQHAVAHRSFGIEGGWLNPLHYRTSLHEYERADRIWVPSEYARQSFLAAGIEPGKVYRRFQPVASRFAAPLSWQPHAGFHVVYVGRVHVTKGVPVLLDAIARLPRTITSLTIVGGVDTGAMEAYMRRRMAADPRIHMGSGDPLPYLHAADVFVHPSYEDGLGLAPLEALACGVPVIVTDDTGMKEYVTPGINGFIVPTGNVDALVGALEAVAAHPLRGQFTPFGSNAHS